MSKSISLAVPTFWLRTPNSFACISVQLRPRPRPRCCQTFIYEVALHNIYLYEFFSIACLLFFFGGIFFVFYECVLINHKYIFYELVCGRDSHFIWNNLWHIGNYSSCSLFFSLPLFAVLSRNGLRASANCCDVDFILDLAWLYLSSWQNVAGDIAQ